VPAPTTTAQSYGPGASYQSLAPAPPSFKRSSTPPRPQSDGKNQRGVFDSKSAMSPLYGRGMMMESTQEIDYSRDSAKDLKPPYSYATMIAQAIFSSEEEKLTLSNIYSFIADKYAFYRHSNSGWQVWRPSPTNPGPGVVLTGFRIPFGTIFHSTRPFRKCLDERTSRAKG